MPSPGDAGASAEGTEGTAFEWRADEAGWLSGIPSHGAGPVDREEWLSQIPVPPEREKAFLPPVTFQIPAQPYGRRKTDLPLADRSYGRRSDDVPLPRDWGGEAEQVLVGRLQEGGAAGQRPRRRFVLTTVMVSVAVVSVLFALVSGPGGSDPAEESVALVSELRADLARVARERDVLEAENSQLQGQADDLRRTVGAEAGDNTFTALAALVARESLDRCTAALGRAASGRLRVADAEAACDRARRDNDALNAAVGAQHERNGLTREQIQGIIDQVNAQAAGG